MSPFGCGMLALSKVEGNATLRNPLKILHDAQRLVAEYLP